MRALAGAVALSCSACHWTSAHDVDASDVTPAAELPEVPPSALKQLDAERLSGRWYVVLSNYDFWRSRQNGTITYRRLPGRAVVKLSDVVAYSERSACGGEIERGTVVGVDLQDPSLPGHFQWRGDGLLHLIVSQWYVVALDPEGRWAVTYFADSNFGTGAGMDVYGREPCLDRATEAEALRAVFRDPFLARRAAGLFRVPHDACRALKSARGAASPRAQATRARR